ncbi:MAG: hypothetical protein GKR94_27270 [Gammaproteobacteria bacterium]|nr:hypothetical protein [Gammaproteobacteria bacterium]
MTHQYYRGIALVIVLWATALLTGIATTYALMMRTEGESSSSFARRVEALALAEAGIHRAIYNLLEAPDEESTWAVNGTPLQIELDGGNVDVRIFAEAGRIDLNRAPIALLTGLAEVAGASDPKAVGAAIVDWRDKDSKVTEAGAEDADYAAAGRPYGAADRPFYSTSELHQLIGVTRPVAAAMQRHSTIFNRSSKVDVTTASSAVLKALPSVDVEQVEQFLRTRAIQLLGPAAASFLRIGTRTFQHRGFFTIEARGITHAGTSATAGVLILLTRSPREPYAVMSATQDFAW